MRRIIRAVGLAAAVAGTLLLGAGPSVAQPLWQAWVTPSDYSCGKTIHHDKSNYVFFQTCIIHGSGHYIQPVLVVSNTSDKTVGIFGETYANWESDGGMSFCHDDHIPPNGRKACYGETSSGRTGVNTAYSIFYMNGVDIGTYSPTASYTLL
ncbi:hypothetical protein [Streptomyces galbus]|uniref:Secreted protein n=1 Tax=Streptomyces galbus TaxID=33898 RepID=A0A4U5X8E8_STRGB|nr:hypothetical protein [Streptomyces galbus]NKQ23589.1 hypothetical protein [Streptomyces galbus]TKT11517.1 hypothetical protein E4U92_01155 [Streptomyces galbus]GHD30678.1 hypothetical protein GCM10010335_20980 [Streptomyces galbus]